MELFVYLWARFKLYFFVERLHQPNSTTLTLLASLLARLLDSGLAKRLARKYKVNPSAWGYVKMTQDSLFFLLLSSAAGRGSHSNQQMPKKK
jgi:hypothetical protein